jgi:hypothetical protein
MKRFGFPAARVQAAAEPIFTHLLMAGSRVKISTIWLFRQAKFFYQSGTRKFPLQYCSTFAGACVSWYYPPGITQNS